MSLTFKQRSRRLDDICKKTTLKKKTNLISEGFIKKSNLSFIQETSKNLLYSSVLGYKKNINLENDFNKIIKRIKKLTPDNITHNGLVVPRKENSLEYSIFLKSIFSFLSSTGIDKIIEYFVSPPQLRIKLGKKVKILMLLRIYTLMHGLIIIQIKVILCIYLYMEILKNLVKFFSLKKF